MNKYEHVEYYVGEIGKFAFVSMLKIRTFVL